MDCTGIYRFHFCPNGLFPALRDYDAQVAEALVIVRALNKITKVGMPENPTATGMLTQKLIYSTKPTEDLTHYRHGDYS